MSVLTDYRTLVEKDFLGTWDLQKEDGSYREAVVTIERVERYRPPVVRKKNGKPEQNKRIVISFKGKRKKWLSGPVTQKTIAAMFGPMIQRWIGKQITLYVDPTVSFGRSVVGGIRVRSTVPEESPTADALDNEVDRARADAIAREFDTDDVPEEEK